MMSKRRRSIENIYSNPKTFASANSREKTHSAKETVSTHDADREQIDDAEGSDFSIYAIPSNKPLTPPPTATNPETHADDVYSIPKSENVITESPDRHTELPKGTFNQRQLSCDDDGVYMTPRRESAPVVQTQVTILPPTRENSIATPLQKTQSLDVSIEHDINSRWRTLRKTVKDPNLREMVDMSQLATPPPSTTNTISNFKRLCDVPSEEEPATPPKLSPKRGNVVRHHIYIYIILPVMSKVARHRNNSTIYNIRRKDPVENGKVNFYAALFRPISYSDR